jgi:hypothetical protein
MVTLGEGIYHTIKSSVIIYWVLLPWTPVLWRCQILVVMTGGCAVYGLTESPMTVTFLFSDL